jgi:phosphomannomutase
LPAAVAPIHFGTSGWRGVLTDEITAPRLRAFAAGVAAWLRESRPDASVLVAHDTRAQGPELAGLAARVLAGAGLRPRPVRSPVPTPVVASALARGEADAALVVTASHNPPAYQGVKVLVRGGGGVSRAQSRRIERHVERFLAGPAPPERRLPQREVDLTAPYLDRLVEQVDREPFARTRLRVVYDALYGTGAGVCDRALRRLGARVEVLRGVPDPRFGGAAPDPTPERLAGLAERVRAGRGPRLGLATDGDADRYAVVDADGRALSETEALALLVDHLARSGRALRGVALSIATGSLVARVAAHHGLAVSRHPIGFKFLSRALLDGRADVAGEESGGFALAALGRDKDGIAACCLFAEIVASDGAPLRARLRALERLHGRRTCGRTALAPPPGSRERLARLRRAPPARVDGTRVRSVDVRDGLHLGFDDGFLMLRASGTEPLLRLYGEAPDRPALRRRFAAGRRLLGSD